MGQPFVALVKEGAAKPEPLNSGRQALFRTAMKALNATDGSTHMPTERVIKALTGPTDAFL